MSGIGVKHEFPCFRCLNTGSYAAPAALLMWRRLQGMELKIMEREIVEWMENLMPEASNGYNTKCIEQFKF